MATKARGGCRDTGIDTEDIDDVAVVVAVVVAVAGGVSPSRSSIAASCL